MLVIKYCEFCISELIDFGELPNCIIECLVKLHFQQNSFILIETDHLKKTSGEPELIRFLELKGFLITTEYDRDRVAVKPMGKLELINKEHYIFCSKSGKHV